MGTLCASEERGQHTLLYIHVVCHTGTEVSGHVDLTHRLEDTQWIDTVRERGILAPNTGDVTLYNWRTGALRFCSSPNWEVVVNNTVIWLLHCPTRMRLLVGRCARKKWKTIKNRALPPGEG